MFVDRWKSKLTFLSGVFLQVLSCVDSCSSGEFLDPDYVAGWVSKFISAHDAFVVDKIFAGSGFNFVTAYDVVVKSSFDS